MKPDLKKEIEKKYLIEYGIDYNNHKEIGKDDLFSGDGVFYIKAKNKEYARKKAIEEIKNRFKRARISFERIEEAI